MRRDRLKQRLCVVRVKKKWTMERMDRRYGRRAGAWWCRREKRADRLRCATGRKRRRPSPVGHGLENSYLLLPRWHGWHRNLIIARLFGECGKGQLLDNGLAVQIDRPDVFLPLSHGADKHNGRGQVHKVDRQCLGIHKCYIEGKRSWGKNSNEKQIVWSAYRRWNGGAGECEKKKKKKEKNEWPFVTMPIILFCFLFFFFFCRQQKDIHKFTNFIFCLVLNNSIIY